MINLIQSFELPTPFPPPPMFHNSKRTIFGVDSPFPEAHSMRFLISSHLTSHLSPPDYSLFFAETGLFFQLFRARPPQGAVLAAGPLQRPGRGGQAFESAASFLLKTWVRTLWFSPPTSSFHSALAFPSSGSHGLLWRTRVF